MPYDAVETLFAGQGLGIGRDYWRGIPLPQRYLQAGRTLVEGRARSGCGTIERVGSGGAPAWDDGELGQPVGRYALWPWSCECDVREPTSTSFACATNAAGNKTSSI